MLKIIAKDILPIYRILLRYRGFLKTSCEKPLGLRASVSDATWVGTLLSK